METLWDRVKKNLIDWYDTAYDKTDELARIGKKKIEIAGVNRAIEKHLSELGGRVYDLIAVHHAATSIESDEKVLRLIEEIKDLEKQLQSKEKEIEVIREEKRHGRQKPSTAGQAEEEQDTGA